MTSKPSIEKTVISCFAEAVESKIKPSTKRRAVDLFSAVVHEKGWSDITYGTPFEKFMDSLTESTMSLLIESELDIGGYYAFSHNVKNIKQAIAVAKIYCQHKDSPSKREAALQPYTRTIGGI